VNEIRSIFIIRIYAEWLFTSVKTIKTKIDVILGKFYLKQTCDVSAILLHCAYEMTVARLQFPCLASTTSQPVADACVTPAKVAEHVSSGPFLVHPAYIPICSCDIEYQYTFEHA